MEMSRQIFCYSCFSGQVFNATCYLNMQSSDKIWSHYTLLCYFPVTFKLLTMMMQMIIIELPA